LKPIITILFLLSPVFTQAQDVAIFCDDQFSDSIREIDNQLVERVDSCVADVVWGAENVCFEGDPQALVERINRGDYQWPYLYAEEAQLNPDDENSVVYVGVDQRNFFANQKSIEPCK